MKSITILLFIFIQLVLPEEVLPQSDSFYFFTSNVLYVPVEASKIEAKNGVTKFTNSKYLELNIGASFDLIGLKARQNTFSFGVDFLTFSNLRSESNFKFPVDAIDYMFGINFNIKRKFSGRNTVSSRLRISHISSHFEDGHIYTRTDTIFTPVVFSKEFIDLAVQDKYEVSDKLSLKGMLGLNYVFHAIPDEIRDFSGQCGLELRYYLTKMFSYYVSNDATLASVNSSTNLNESFETGLSIGEVDSRSVDFYFDYYDGQDYRGQYYGDYLNYKGLGVRFKF